jgi:hypothetical protein
VVPKSIPTAGAMVDEKIEIDEGITERSTE